MNDITYTIDLSGTVAHPEFVICKKEGGQLTQLPLSFSSPEEVLSYTNGKKWDVRWSETANNHALTFGLI
jgi:hypothetical protein